MLWAFCAGLAVALALVSLRALTCEGDNVLRTSGALFHLSLQPSPSWLPVSSHSPPISPSRFSVPRIYLGSTSGSPEMSLQGKQGPPVEQQGNHLSTRPSAPSCQRVRAPGLSPAVRGAAREPLSVTLWTHTPSHLFPKRGCGVTCWWLFVSLGMLTRTWAVACWQGGNVPVKGLGAWWLIPAALDVEPGRTLPGRRLRLRTQHIGQLKLDRFITGVPSLAQKEKGGNTLGTSEPEITVVPAQSGGHTQGTVWGNVCA